MARSWTICVCECGCVHDLIDAGCPQCGTLHYMKLTAIDQRDVEPLVKAAHRLLQGNADERAIGDLPMALRDALKPFEETGEES